MTKTFLDHVYADMTQDATNALYDAWAQSYDQEVAENGYVTPGRVAKAMADHIADKSVPLLDYGCGTGLSGLALRTHGFEQVDGMDPSDDMIAQARSKACYRELITLGLEDPAPIKQPYMAITAIGVIGTGAAPASTFDVILKALPKGGILGVSLNDHALAEKTYEGALNQWLDLGAARLLFKEHGEHLPGQNIKSNVYIIEKA